MTPFSLRKGFYNGGFLMLLKDPLGSARTKFLVVGAN